MTNVELSSPSVKSPSARDIASACLFAGAKLSSPVELPGDGGSGCVIGVEADDVPTFLGGARCRFFPASDELDADEDDDGAGAFVETPNGRVDCFVFDMLFSF